MPVALRGTTSGAKMIHISDWCALVNVALISSLSVKRLVQSGPKKTNLGIRLFAEVSDVLQSRRRGSD